MNPLDTLKALKQRQEYIESTVGKVTTSYALMTEDKKTSWPVIQTMKKLDSLKLEWEENKVKILDLESSNDLNIAKVKKPVGRPKKIEGDNFFLPNDEERRSEYIETLEKSIESDLREIEAAKIKLDLFIQSKQSKIDYKRNLIALTRDKLGLGVKVEDL